MLQNVVLSLLEIFFRDLSDGRCCCHLPDEDEGCPFPRATRQARLVLFLVYWIVAFERCPSVICAPMQRPQWRIGTMAQWQRRRPSTAFATSLAALYCS